MNVRELTDLKKDFTGEIILPGDGAYEQASHTLMSKGAPAIVVQPHTAKDVAAAIRYAQNHSLLVSIRSGGHSAVGFSTNNGGLVIDLACMNNIEIIDDNKNIVRIGAGAKWGAVGKALLEHQLALTSGDTTSVGVGGLTLGGGIGWMVRKYGLAIDNLVGAELVTANGRILRTSATEHPDLFWAIRGGGGNFGVVTSFDFVAHPLKQVFAGMVQYNLDTLPATLKGWRDAMANASEDLSSTFVVMPSFGGNPPMAMILLCYAGDDQKVAMKAIDPLLHLGQVTHQDIKKKDYPDVLEEPMLPPDTIRIIVKNVFAEKFSDAMIEAVAAASGKPGSPVLQIRSLGGAMNRIASDATAFAHRNSEVWVMGATFVPPSASESDVNQALQPWSRIAAFGSGAYANFLSTTTAQDLADIYPKKTYERLAAIKKVYDPQNIFNQNYNVKPIEHA